MRKSKNCMWTGREGSGKTFWAFVSCVSKFKYLSTDGIVVKDEVCPFCKKKIQFNLGECFITARG